MSLLQILAFHWYINKVILFSHNTQKSGTLVLSMDALFGLPRKKAAGKSQRDALHGHLFFGDQVMSMWYLMIHIGNKQLKPKV